MKSHVQPAEGSEELDDNAENLDGVGMKRMRMGTCGGDCPEPETAQNEEDYGNGEVSSDEPTTESPVDLKRSAQLPFKGTREEPKILFEKLQTCRQALSANLQELEMEFRVLKEADEMISGRVFPAGTILLVQQRNNAYKEYFRAYDILSKKRRAEDPITGQGFLEINPQRSCEGGLYKASVTGKTDACPFSNILSSGTASLCMEGENIKIRFRSAKCVLCDNFMRRTMSRNEGEANRQAFCSSENSDEQIRPEQGDRAM
ncbi:MAG: hypothetical protein Q9188_001253 [Gyalolechia gomerana]